MGFGGSVSTMLTSLKNNERQRKRRVHFDKEKAGGYGEQVKPEFNLPQATPQVLREIRNKMEVQRRKFLFRASIVGILFLILVLITLNYLG